ncbi:TM2 domain-containing protein [Sphingomonas arenae]|uniref:TM2 domain-containing protein n=1 Tax=Sphingomonas arenae TaxID=2812555 RepID=UPI001F3D7B19|nr:TM2 domain-containing protein [Sphingomonas arenae]
MTGFGRKGSVGGTDSSARQQFGAAQPVRQATAAADHGLSPQARAFLAAERSRKSSEPAPAPLSAYESAALLQPTVAKPMKSLAVAYLLWWFGATFAAHRFYLGAYRSGAAMLGLFWGGLLLGAVMSKTSSMWVGDVAVPPLWAAMILVWMIWCVVDAFLIPGLRRRHAQVGANRSLSTVFA